MKNSILFTLLLLFSSMSFAQEARFGFTVSPSFGFANVEPSNDIENYNEDSESKTGIVYGVLMDYDFSGEDRYFIHSGLMMHHTGYELEYTRLIGGDATGNENADLNVNYLEIPFILKLKTNEIGYVRYFGQFGLNNAVKVGDKLQEGNDTEFTDAGTFNTGLNMGGGLEYSISQQTSAVAGVYYVNGFSKVFDNTAGSIKQNQLGIRLGVYF